jgi:hypothetical protein
MYNIQKPQYSRYILEFWNYSAKSAARWNKLSLAGKTKALSIRLQFHSWCRQARWARKKVNEGTSTTHRFGSGLSNSLNPSVIFHASHPISRCTAESKRFPEGLSNSCCNTLRSHLGLCSGESAIAARVDSYLQSCTRTLQLNKLLQLNESTWTYNSFW